MLFKRVSRSAPEQIFVVAKNVSGGTLTAGYWAAWDTGASADGVRVTQVAATTYAAIAGVADADIANNDYGLIQVFGYRSSAYVYSSTGSSTYGDYLAPSGAYWGMTPYAASATLYGVGFLCGTVTASSSSQYYTTAKVFVKTL